MAEEPKYDYTDLCDLYEGAQHVYGVVVSFARKQLKNTHVLEMNVTDESLDGSPQQSMLCCIYATSAEKLPQITKNGDIIRIHRIQCTKRKDKLELRGTIGVMGLACAVWSNETPLQTPLTTSKTVTLENSDFIKIEQLRRFYTRIQDQHLNSANVSSSSIHCLADFHPTSYRNVLVRVVGCFHSTQTDQEDKCIPYVVRVCDGTQIKLMGSPLNLCKVDLEAEPFTVDGINEKVNELIPEYCVDIFNYDEHKDSASKLQPGDYVLFHNLHLFRTKGTQPKISLVMHGKGQNYGRNIIKLPGDDPNVLIVQSRLYDQLNDLVEGETDLNGKDDVPLGNDESSANDNAVIGLETNSLEGELNTSGGVFLDCLRGSEEPFQTPPDSPIPISLSNTGEGSGSDCDVQISQPPVKVRRYRGVVQVTENSVQTGDSTAHPNVNHMDMNPLVRLDRLHFTNGYNNMATEVYCKQKLVRDFESLAEGQRFTIKNLTARSFLPEKDLENLIYFECSACAKRTYFGRVFNKSNVKFVCQDPACQTNKAELKLGMCLFAFVPYSDESDDFLIVFETTILEKVLNRTPEEVKCSIVKDKLELMPDILKLKESSWDCTVQVSTYLKCKALNIIHFNWSQS